MVFVSVPMLCLWKGPPGPPSLSTRAVHPFAEASRGGAPPAPPLHLSLFKEHSCFRVSTLTQEAASESHFPVAVIFQQFQKFQKSVLTCNAQRKKRTCPFPFLYLCLRTREMLLRGPYFRPINPSVSPARAGSPVHASPSPWQEKWD